MLYFKNTNRARAFVDIETTLSLSLNIIKIVLIINYINILTSLFRYNSYIVEPQLYKYILYIKIYFYILPSIYTKFIKKSVQLFYNYHWNSYETTRAQYL